MAQNLIQTEATAPAMGQLRLAFLMWKLQARRLRGTCPNH